MNALNNGTKAHGQVHAVGGRLIIDSTFAPPPLQDPFKQGADVVLHSGERR